MSRFICTFIIVFLGIGCSIEPGLKEVSLDELRSHIAKCDIAYLEIVFSGKENTEVLAEITLQSNMKKGPHLKYLVINRDAFVDSVKLWSSKCDFNYDSSVSANWFF
ncbi:MAG: hypothetical protein JKY54_06110 [Flavobacteriales bacterium]|nr:hypothetical protein [Flavobacteriales bacterium]